MIKSNFSLTKHILCFGLVLLLFLTNVHIYAQQKTIRILNEKTTQPVSDVFFSYHKTSGFSNQQGEINIEFIDSGRLYLSHIQYGKIKVDANDLKRALETGLLKIAAENNYLLPVTFITVHAGAGERSYLDIPVQEKLEHDAGQLLEQLPAISLIRKSGAYGFDPVLRGFKYDQLNLVIDGSQTASAACPNRMDPASSQIPINMISKVEVTKGPYSLRYGNAFGGTVNFKSSVPQFAEKAKPVGRLGTSYESNGNVFRTEGVAGVSGKKADLKFFGAYSKGNDYADGEGVRIPADFNRLNWGGKAGFKLGDKQNLGVLVSNNRAHDVDFPALPMDLRDDNTWLFNANHTAYFYDKAITTWNTTAYFTKVNHLMDNYSKMMDPRTVDAETEANTSNYGGRSELRFDFENGFLFSGFDYRFESADGYRTRNVLMGPMKGKIFTDNVWQDAQIRRAGIFGEYHFAKPGFLLVFSGRLDHNSAQSGNPDPKFAQMYVAMNSAFVDPSFSAGGTKMLGKNVSLGLWLGSAQRSPGIAERYINFFPIGLDPYEMIGDPQLKPETNNQADLIFEYSSANTNINVNLFSSFLRNYISSEIDPGVKPKMATSPGVRRFVNIDNARISGFEIGWQQQIASVLRHDFSAVYTHGENRSLDEPLPEIPPMEFKYRLMGSFLKGKIQPEILFRQVLAQERVAISYGETESPAFRVVDAKISCLPTARLTASGGILNLFDVAYYEHLSRSVRGPETRPIYSPGRSFFVTLTFNFL